MHVREHARMQKTICINQMPTAVAGPDQDNKRAMLRGLYYFCLIIVVNTECFTEYSVKMVPDIYSW